MATSSLTLDRSDPGVDELVSSWKDGGEYTVQLTIKQVNSSPNAANYEVVGITDMGESEPAEEMEMEEEEMPPAAAPKGKAAIAVKY